MFGKRLVYMLILYLCLVAVGCGPGELTDRHLSLLTIEEINVIVGRDWELAKKTEFPSGEEKTRVTIRFIPQRYVDKVWKRGPKEGVVELTIGKVSDLEDDYRRQLKVSEDFEVTVEGIPGLGWKAYKYKTRYTNIIFFWNKTESLKIRLVAWNSRHTVFEDGVFYDPFEDWIAEGEGTYVPMDQLEKIAGIIQSRLE